MQMFSTRWRHVKSTRDAGYARDAGGELTHSPLVIVKWCFNGLYDPFKGISTCDGCMASNLGQSRSNNAVVRIQMIPLFYT